MWHIGDHVIYGTTGLCRIEEIKEQKVIDKIDLYYILKPVYDKKSMVSVPCNSEYLTNKMRTPMKKKGMEDFLDSLKSDGCEWISNDKERNAVFREIIDSGDRKRLMFLIRSTHERKLELLKSGRKLRSSDEEFLRVAERLIFDEVSFVMEVDRNRVSEYIFDKTVQKDESLLTTAQKCDINTMK